MLGRSTNPASTASFSTGLANTERLEARLNAALPKPAAKSVGDDGAPRSAKALIFGNRNAPILPTELPKPPAADFCVAVIPPAGALARLLGCENLLAGLYEEPRLLKKLRGKPNPPPPPPPQPSGPLAQNPLGSVNVSGLLNT